MFQACTGSISRQVDLCGSIHLTDVVTVEFSTRVILHAAPNPVQKEATVSFAVPEATEATVTSPMCSAKRQSKSQHRTTGR